MLERIAIGISYQGTAYHGWQSQPDQTSTLQQRITHAISMLAKHAIELIASGRTDAGVHAHQQVAHFSTSALRDEHTWLSGVNHYLPDDIRVNWVKKVDKNFHARFCAKRRLYEYKILNAPVNSPFYVNSHTWVYQTLDLSAMAQALEIFVGTHDFNAFRNSACQAKSSVREIYHAQISATDNVITTTIEGNSFLHNMVRNIMGMLILVGMDKKTASDVQAMLGSKLRPSGAPTAPARGLYLAKVFYDKAVLDITEGKANL
jgi:tRNA pseudouridine38-40 synthase